MAIHGHHQALVIGIKWQPCAKREPVDRQMSTFASDSIPKGGEWSVANGWQLVLMREPEEVEEEEEEKNEGVRCVHRIFSISVPFRSSSAERLRGTPTLRPFLLFLFPSFCNVGNRILIRFSASLLSFLFFARDGLAGDGPPV